MMLRRSENLMYQLVVRLDDLDPLSPTWLGNLAYLPSSELDMETLLRNTSKKQRDRALKSSKPYQKNGSSQDVNTSSHC